MSARRPDYVSLPNCGSVRLLRDGRIEMMLTPEAAEALATELHYAAKGDRGFQEMSAALFARTLPAGCSGSNPLNPWIPGPASNLTKTEV